MNPTRNIINFKSGISIDTKLFDKINVDATVSEYSHAERVLEDKHNIEFFNDAYEIKTSLNHKPLFTYSSGGLIGFHFPCFALFCVDCPKQA